MARALRSIAAAFLAAACAQRPVPVPAWTPPDVPIALVPDVAKLQRGTGVFVAADVEIRITHTSPDEDEAAAETLADEIRRAGGRPRITRTPSGKARAPLIQLVRGADPTLGDEGYTVEVARDHVVVSAPAAAGVYYGVQTLRQLLRPRPTGGAFAIPVVTIRDKPAMRWRGAMDDVSRGPVPTVAYVKEQIRTLAEFKLNLYSLYFESVFDAAAHPLVARPDGAFTAEELRELVAFARRHHVTLLPQQQTFGHLHGMLMYEQYQEVAERPHGHVLAPGDKANALVDELLAELVPIFPGPFFHVGADETFELGLGKSAARAASEGLGTVYLSHLARMAEKLARDGKEMLFWGDIAEHYPQLLGMLPKNSIAVAWDYDPRESFQHKVEPFRRSGLRFFVAPGSNSWSRIVPHYASAYTNIANFIRDGHAAGALGALITTWDDDGDSMFDLTWPTIVFGAACAWTGGTASITEFEDRYDWAFYRNDDHTFRDVLRALGHAHTVLAPVKRGPSNDALWLDPFSAEGVVYTSTTLSMLGDVRLGAERALTALRRNRKRARAHAETLPVLELAARRLDAYGLKFQLADEVARSYAEAHAAAANGASNREAVWGPLREVSDIDGRLQDLRDVFLELKRLHAAVWPRENRASYLDSILIRYDRFALDIEAKIQAVSRARMRFRATGTLPSPIELGLAQPAQPAK